MGKGKLAKSFYREWFKRAFTKPLLYVDLLAGFLAIVFAAISYFCPLGSSLMNLLAWAIPLGVFAASLVVGAVLAPYLIHKDEREKSDRLKAELDDVRSTQPCISVRHVVHYNCAKLEIKNMGIEADFTATARVVEGIVRPELYSMCWEPYPVTPRHIDKTETATILVAEKAKQTLNADWAEKAVFKDGIALFKSVGGKQEVFGASTMVQVQKRKLNERYPTMKKAYTLEDKCVIEVTITATPSLLEPFGRRYSLEIDDKRELLFAPMTEQEIDKGGSQT